MDINERVAQTIEAAGQRTEERLALWEAIATSFDEAGPEGVEAQLSRRMGLIRSRFDELLRRLQEML